MIKKLLIAIFLFITAPANASDLKSIFDAAITNDPLLSSADYLRYAAKNDKNKECGQLLPQATATGSYTNYDQDDSGIILGDTSANTSNSVTGDQIVLGITVQQTLFDLPKINACRLGRIQMNHEDAQYEIAREDLIYKVITTYIDVLRAKKNLSTANGAAQLYQSLLNESEKAFGTRTMSQRQLDSAIANHEKAKAQKILAQNDLATAEMALNYISSGISLDKDLPSLRDNMTLLVPEPLDPEHWSNMAEEYNLKVIESLLDSEMSEYRLKVERSKHLPTVNLFARHNDYDTDLDNSTADNDFSNDTLGVRVTWKLFAGGSNYNSASAAKHRYKSSQKLHEAMRRNARMQAHQAVLAIKAAIANIESAKSSLASAKSNLKAIESGIKARTNKTSDLLDAKHNLLMAQQEHDNSRYNYIISIVNFWQSVGSLTEDSIEEVNNWFALPRIARWQRFRKQDNQDKTQQELMKPITDSWKRNMS